MKKLLKQLLQIVSDFVPLWLYRRLFPQELTAFFYHAVSDDEMPHVKHLYPPVAVERFERALLYLKRNFNPVTYAEVHQHVGEGTTLPDRAVLLSFDDGFGECFSVVRPLLLKHDIACTFFVATNWLDNQAMFYRNKVSLCIEAMRMCEKDAKAMVLNSLTNVLGTTLKSSDEFEGWVRSLTHADEGYVDMTCKMLGIDVDAYMREKQVFMTRDQIQQLAEEGFTIGSHTCSHPKLAKVSREEMEAEIVDSSRMVQEITGQDIVPFSFPFSAFGIDRDVLADIRERHAFLGLFFDTKGLQPDADFIVNRIWAEKPEFSDVGKQTNIPHLLRAAYGELVLGARK